MDDRVSGALARPRLNAIVTAMFGGTVTALAAMGIYGVLAYGISMRRREIAIRVALGATPQRVRTLVLAQGLKLAIAGAAIGLGLGAWTLRLMSGMLYGVRPADPWVLGAATCAMLAVAVLASLLPSWRASRTDPMVVLRAE
jgi:ABC-type antimicrobial peptide transport system permease subunit